MDLDPLVGLFDALAHEPSLIISAILSGIGIAVTIYYGRCPRCLSGRGQKPRGEEGRGAARGVSVGAGVIDSDPDPVGE